MMSKLLCNQKTKTNKKQKKNIRAWFINTYINSLEKITLIKIKHTESMTKTKRLL